MLEQRTILGQRGQERRELDRDGCGRQGGLLTTTLAAAAFLSGRGFPFTDNADQTIETAEKPQLDERRIQRRNRRAIESLELKMRRAQQRRRGATRETGRDEFDHEVERGRVRLRRERQRVHRLERHARAGKDVAGHIEVGQRARHDERRAIEAHLAARAPVGLQSPRDALELFLAIAIRKHQRLLMSLT